MHFFRISPIVLLLAACASGQTKKTSDKLPSQATDQHKVEYLKELDKLQNQLKKAAQICRQYTQKKLVNILQFSSNKDQYPFGVKFKKMSSKKLAQQLDSYRPHQFDWKTKAKLKALYLDYPFDRDNVKLNTELPHKIQDCMNDFDNQSYLFAIVDLLEKNEQSPTIKAKSRAALQRYFSYIKSGEVELLNILLAQQLIQQMAIYDIVKINSPDEFKIKVSHMESVYNKSGQSILKSFRKQDMQQIFSLESKLRQEKRQYKEFLLSSFKFK